MTMAMPYAGEEARERRDALIAAALTLLYFLLVSFFWFSSEAITRLRKTEDAPQVRQITSLKRLPPAPPQAAAPPDSRFVDASGLQESKNVDPRTALESDRNTAAASKVITGTDPTLGGQEGKKDDSLTMRSSQFSPNQASPPPAAAAPARLSPTAPPPKPKPAPSPALPKPQDQIKPIPGPGTPIEKASTDTPPDAKPDQSQDATPPTPSAAQAAADASDSSSALAPPPDIFRDRSAVSGGAQLGQDASFASMSTALGRYQHKLYLAIGSRWNLRIQQTMAQIGVDRVVIRFHVNPDGSISDLDVIQGNPNSMLSVVSADSIQQSSNLIGPFPDDLKKDKPNGFPWQLAFRIY
jgi:outer membrane biosynthesis protein TonB